MVSSLILLPSTKRHAPLCSHRRDHWVDMLYTDTRGTNVGDHVSHTQLPHMYTTHSRVFLQLHVMSRLHHGAAPVNHADAPMGGVVVATCSCDHVE